jgi:putative DNA primase/helicase
MKKIDYPNHDGSDPLEGENDMPAFASIADEIERERLFEEKKAAKEAEKLYPEIANIKNRDIKDERLQEIVNYYKDTKPDRSELEIIANVEFYRKWKDHTKERRALEYIRSRLYLSYVYTYERGWMRYRRGCWVEDSYERIFADLRKLVDKDIEIIERLAAKFNTEKMIIKDFYRSIYVRSTIENALALAKGEQEFSIPLDEFDKNPYILNCTNVIVDLESGAAKKHTPMQKTRMQTNTSYIANAPCPNWLKFLDTVFQSNQELIEYVQRALGYSISGDTSEQCLFICYGTGQNGKSTFMRVVLEILGTYAGVINMSAFLENNNDVIRSDLAGLKGKRFVSANETNSNKQFDSAILKKVTGEDKIKCRFLYKDYFEYTPTFKIWMALNHLPFVNEQTKAFWRRIKVIPFTVQISDDQIDKNLTQKLLAESEGILYWMVQGFQKWRKNGLGTCQAVEEITKEYKEDNDTLKDFLEQYCEIGSDYEATTTDLYDAYEKYCDENNVKEHFRLSQRNFAMKLKERGFERTKHIRIGDEEFRGFKGLRLKESILHDTEEKEVDF